MKNLVSILIFISFFQFSYAEGGKNERNSGNNPSTSDTSQVVTKNAQLNTTSNLEYQLRYQNFKNDFLSLNSPSENYYDILTKKKKKRRKKSGAIDQSLIYFSAGTGVLILTPTILSAVDKDVSVGGALAADFILAGILTYAILSER
ncbi:MAG: hypothetical protein JXB49_20885 [Bacteroidales bacterium]|nr:hypothetical protein [Bacteroidales bacterium]